MTNDYQGIIVYASADGAAPSRATLELLGEGRRLVTRMAAGRGGPPLLAAVICGHGVTAAARALTGLADRVHCWDDPGLAAYHPGLYTRILAGLVAQYRPEIMLFPAGCTGQELAATLAARLKTGLVSHAVGLEIDGEGRLVPLVATYGEGLLGEMLCPDHRPQMVTVAPGLLEPASPGPGPGRLIREDAPPPEDSRLIATAVEEKTAAGRLEDAVLVLAGGSGLRDQDNWRALEQLGALLRAPVGCTRPVLDEGWSDEEHRMIGISGTVVGPAVYLAAGISGSAHHTVGMDRSDYVIAVNSDPGAPLAKMADLTVVGDAGAIIREMLRILGEKKEAADS